MAHPQMAHMGGQVYMQNMWPQGAVQAGAGDQAAAAAGA